MSLSFQPNLGSWEHFLKYSFSVTNKNSVTEIPALLLQIILMLSSVSEDNIALIFSWSL
jgi:hypothetical protein